MHSCWRNNGFYLRYASLKKRTILRLIEAGTVTIFQYGAGQAGVMRTLGRYMLMSGGTFGYASFGV